MALFLFSCDRVRRRGLRKLVPLPAVEFPASGLRPQPSPLFKEKRYTLGLALVAYRPHPCAFHGSSLGPALATNNHPIDAGEVDVVNGPDQRFDGKEADACRCLL